MGGLLTLHVLGKSFSSRTAPDNADASCKQPARSLLLELRYCGLTCGFFPGFHCGRKFEFASQRIGSISDPITVSINLRSTCCRSSSESPGKEF